jgi:hypothetical protein
MSKSKALLREIGICRYLFDVDKINLFRDKRSIFQFLVFSKRIIIDKEIPNVILQEPLLKRVNNPTKKPIVDINKHDRSLAWDIQEDMTRIVICI